MAEDYKHCMEKIRCNLCGSDNYSILYKAKYDKLTKKDLVEKYRSSGDERLIDEVVKCNKCGLIYVNPRIKSSIILNAYSKGKDENFVSQAKGRELTFSKHLKLIEKYSKKGKILDTGTAGGSFLYVAKKSGWDVYGVEPNKWLCRWGKKHYGLNIWTGTIFDVKFKKNYFDVITLWDVLEHTPDPKRVLKKCNELLKKNGLLVVNYPDIGSWVSKVMGSRWVFLLSVHLFYFNKKTIKRLLDNTRFEPILIKPHFQKLALDYLILRMKAYNKFLHTVGRKAIQFLGIGKVQIPYWLGQTLILARKK